ncbi:MAG TPA: tetratricopeptide repeat protein, partial [Aggregatilineales bacterium]|nr:tetratricopeptide repeat protein [Aggregatilineales bacterium]
RVSFEQLRFLLSPYPMVEFLPILVGYLSDMGFFRYDWETKYIFMKPNVRQNILKYIPKGDNTHTGFRIQLYKAGREGRPFPIYNEYPFNERYLPFAQISLTEHMATYHFLMHAGYLNKEYRVFSDLEHHFLEMEYELIAEDYDYVARELTNIDYDYLIPWGYLEVAERWHKRVQGKIEDAKTRANQEGHLGFVYEAMGKLREAIQQYEIAASINWDEGYVDGVNVWIGNMGLAYGNIGQIETGITYIQQALTCVASIENNMRRKDEMARNMSNLCIKYRQLGDYATAISYIEQAIVLTEEVGGDNDISKRSGTLGSTYMLMGEYEKAKPILTEAVEKWLNTKFLTKPHVIALARLLWFMGDLDGAQHYLQVEEKYDADDRSIIWALSGCIQLSQNNHQRAQAHFEQSLEWSSIHLAQTHDLYYEHNARGLAYTGLWCISGDVEHFDNAKKSYQTARDICDAKGILSEHRQMLRHLLSYAPDRDGAGLLALLD